MPRYFFHALNRIRAQDHDGVELPDIGAARREALKDVDESGGDAAQPTARQLAFPPSGNSLLVVSRTPRQLIMKLQNIHPTERRSQSRLRITSQEATNHRRAPPW
jgi:hypothetical protein